MMRNRCAALLLAACTLVWTGTAEAGGNEYAGAGPRALGRAGAVMAKAEDPMVMFYNPAGLAELRGAQLLAGFNTGFFNGCMDPQGYYGWGTSNLPLSIRLPDPDTGEPVTVDVPNDPDYHADPLDTVCNRQRLQLVPQLGGTWRLSERIGIGAGLIYPGFHPPGTYQDNDQGVIVGDTGEPRPSPARYMLREYNTIAFFPTLAAGLRITDWLRVGASFQWSIFQVDQEINVAQIPGTNPAADFLFRAEATDYFVPIGIFSVHAVPIDALDIVGRVRVQDTVSASGTATLTSGLYDPRMVPRTTEIEMSEISQRQPWSVGLGIRFADRIRPRPEGTGMGEVDRGELHDPMTDENWDIELDVVYELNSRNDKQTLIADSSPCQEQPDGSLTGCQTLVQEFTDGRIREPRYPLDAKHVPKHWQDQISVRLGGSYNIVPGVFSASAGVHYETRGIDPDFMQLDFWPLQRVGLHTGVVVRIAHRVDVILSYAHIFQETIEIAAPPHNPDVEGGFDRTVTSQDCGPEGCQPVDPQNPIQNPDGVARQPQNITGEEAETAWKVNAGRYRSSFDLFALGVNMHF